MDNIPVTKRIRRTRTHNPPPPLQLLGCGGGGWGGLCALTPPPAFRTVLVGFRAVSAGMGWTHATHSCATVCSPLAYLCQTPTNTRRRFEPTCCYCKYEIGEERLVKTHVDKCRQDCVTCTYMLLCLRTAS